MKRLVLVISFGLSSVMPLIGGFAMRSGGSHGHIGHAVEKSGSSMFEHEKHSDQVSDHHELAPHQDHPVMPAEHHSQDHSANAAEHQPQSHEHHDASLAPEQQVAAVGNMNQQEEETQEELEIDDLDDVQQPDFVADNPEIEHVSLDTIDVDGGGNWLEKRIWYERAQNLFDEIQFAVKKIVDLRLQFSNEVNGIGHKIDMFYENVDFNKGQLDEKFKDILAQLDQEQKLKGDLSVAEKNLQISIKQEQVSIDQIGKDIKSIGDIDNKIDQTLVLAFKTIDDCVDYEAKAWKTFKTIGKELDDKKARSLYYEMNNFKQNIDQKSTYLRLTLLPYLHNTLIDKIERNIARIGSTIDQLKSKGVDLQAIMSKTQQDSLALLKEREKEAVTIAVEKALEQEREQEKLAAEKAQAALEKAQKESYSYVMHQYYQATIGQVIDVVSSTCTYTVSVITGLVYNSFQFIKSYVLPEIKKVEAEIVQEVQMLEKQLDAAAQQGAKIDELEQIY